MNKKILEILTFQSKVCVIQLDLSDHTYTFSVFQEKKGELKQLKHSKSYSQIEKLWKELPKNAPFILHLSGKGILNKKVKNKPNYRSSALLNANEDEFYFYEYTTQENVFISVLRKDVLNNEILKFKAKSLFVVDTFFGPFILETNQVIPNSPNQFKTDKNTYSFKDGKLDHYTKSNDTDHPNAINLGKQKTKEIYATAIAKKYYENKKQNKVNSGLFAKDQQRKILFNRAGIFVLSFFLISLTLNFVWIDQLNKKVALQNEKLAIHQEALNQIKQLKDEKKRKLKLLRTSGILNSNFISFYLDELAATIPSSISLEGLEVYPIQNNIKPNKLIKINDQSIFISGLTQNSQPLNNWIQDLSQKEWIEKIEILSYNKKRKNNYEFEIEMRLK